jgi:hypothetical protein
MKNKIAMDINLIFTPWPLVRKRTIPTDRPPLVGREVSRGQRGESPTVVNLSFIDRSR